MVKFFFYIIKCYYKHEKTQLLAFEVLKNYVHTCRVQSQSLETVLNQIKQTKKILSSQQNSVLNDQDVDNVKNFKAITLWNITILRGVSNLTSRSELAELSYTDHLLL